MLSILISVVILAVIIWVLTLLPIPAPWNQVLIAVIVILFLIFLLQGGGNLGTLNLRN